MIEINGFVLKPLSISVDYIKSRPKVILPIMSECADADLMNSSDPNSITCRIWTGCNLMDIVDDICGGVTAEAKYVLFTSLDGKYTKEMRIDEDILHDCILGYEVDGKPLTSERGYPLRLIVPGWYGIYSVKALKKIEFTNVEKKDDSWKHNITAIKPKGFIWLPDSISRGKVMLEGRCWVGGSTYRKTYNPCEIVRVRLSFDGGLTWMDTIIDDINIEGVSSLLWSCKKWSYEWDAEPGYRMLMVKATDNRCLSQPMELEYDMKNQDKVNISESIKINVL